jgi:hypothetical protein
MARTAREQRTLQTKERVLLTAQWLLTYATSACRAPSAHEPAAVLTRDLLHVGAGRFRTCAGALPPDPSSCPPFWTGTGFLPNPGHQRSGWTRTAAKAR